MYSEDKTVPSEDLVQNLKSAYKHHIENHILR